jgi:hypothetical protein
LSRALDEKEPRKKGGGSQINSIRRDKMSNYFKELEEVSCKLGQKVNKLDAVILAVNKRLTLLGLVSEAWLDYSPIACIDFEDRYQDGEKCGLQREVALLGCYQLGEHWELAVKRGEQTDKYELFNSYSLGSLTSQTMEFQMKALRLMPALLAEIKKQHDDILIGFEEAEAAAETAGDK